MKKLTPAMRFVEYGINNQIISKIVLVVGCGGGGGGGGGGGDGCSEFPLAILDLVPLSHAQSSKFRKRLLSLISFRF